VDVHVESRVRAVGRVADDRLAVLRLQGSSPPADRRTIRADERSRAPPAPITLSYPSRPPRSTLVKSPTARSRTKTPPVLGLRALNRALLERQMLLRRSKRSPLAAIERLVGVQAQAPNPPYVALWTRLASFRADELGQLLIDRRVVRVALMRSTIHLVTADDCLLLRPLVQPVLDRELKGSAHGRNLSGLEIDEIVAAARTLVDEHPLTGTALGERLCERWPDRYPRSLAYAVRNRIPLVHLPPRGVWGKSGQPTMTTAESWLGRPLDAAPSLDALILRYLAAFGPATVRDVQAWSGLTRLRENLERLRPDLSVFRDEEGAELFDLPDAPRPDPDTPAPVRFLAEFDNALLSHANRRRIIADDHRKRISTSNGMIPGAVLVDGFLRGIWRIARTRGVATLMIRPYARILKADRAALADEGARLLGFIAPALAHEVQFAPL
jgi:hypothetical protein